MSFHNFSNEFIADSKFPATIPLSTWSWIKNENFCNALKGFGSLQHKWGPTQLPGVAETVLENYLGNSPEVVIALRKACSSIFVKFGSYYLFYAMFGRIHCVFYSHKIKNNFS